MRPDASRLIGLVLLPIVLGLRAAPACGDGEPAAALPVRAIEIRCAAPIDVAGLRGMLPFRPGEPLAADALTRARTLLDETGIFTDIDLEAEPREDGVAVTIALVRRPVINLLWIRGNETLSQSRLFRLIRVRENALLNETLLDESAERVRRAYRHEGFESVRVEAEVNDRSPGEVDVIFRIDEGEPTLIVGIAVDGEAALPLPRAEVRKAIGLEVGDRHTRDGDRAAVKNLIQLFRRYDYYEVSVRSRWEPGVAATGTLHLRIDPGPLLTVGFTGNTHFKAATLLGLMDFKTRAIVTDGTWRELARRIRRHYLEAGFYFVQVDLAIDRGDPKAIRFAIREGERYRVAAVRFEGKSGLSAGQLRSQMATGSRGIRLWHTPVLLDDVLDDDVKRLRSFYRQHGYLNAEIVDKRFSFDAAAGTVEVTLIVEAGPQTIVREIVPVDFEPEGGALPAFRSRIGRPVSTDAVEADRVALQRRLVDRGYESATVDAEIVTARDGDALAGTIRLTATPGERIRVGAVVVQNAVDTRWSLIERQAQVVVDRPLNEAALLEGQARLYRLGLFRSVNVRPLDSGPAPGVRDVGIAVTERPPGNLLWGGGYNTRDGLRVFGEIATSNLQGLGRRLSLRGDFSIDPSHGFVPDQYIGTLGYRVPRVFGSEWTARATLLANRSTRSVDQFSIERYALVPAVERPFARGLILGVDYLAERSRSFDLARPVLAFNPADAEWMWAFGPGPFALYDSRDDPFLPRRGFFDSLTTRLAPAQLGSSVPFATVQALHSQYIPVFDDVIFVYALRGGYGDAFDGGAQVPIRSRFFLGGRATVRGFAENSIGPTVGNANDPLGGDLMANVNLELRFPLLWGFGGAVFSDGGGVYLQNCEAANDEPIENCAIDFDNFRRSAGMGLRYITPVGPLSLDYGIKLDRRAGESFGEIHFSVGNIF
ncbi:BamA/TamA family outer membrane protein [Candidatus Binatia bacterium]|nr:BamA/TamA family outer membrane protein [Candidatus Binatia bacterium]